MQNTVQMTLRNQVVSLKTLYLAEAIDSPTVGRAVLIVPREQESRHCLAAPVWLAFGDGPSRREIVGEVVAAHVMEDFSAAPEMAITFTSYLHRLDRHERCQRTSPQTLENVITTLLQQYDYAPQQIQFRCLAREKEVPYHAQIPHESEGGFLRRLLYAGQLHYWISSKAGLEYIYFSSTLHSSPYLNKTFYYQTAQGFQQAPYIHALAQYHQKDALPVMQGKSNYALLAPGYCAVIDCEEHSECETGDYYLTHVITHIQREAGQYCLSNQFSAIPLSAITTRHVPCAKPALTQPPSLLLATVAGEQDQMDIDDQGRQRVYQQGTEGVSVPLNSVTACAGASNSGQAQGWAWPLPGGAEVWLACLEDDPRQAVILGTAANGKYPSSANQTTRHQLVSHGGQACFLEDTESSPHILLQTAEANSQIQWSGPLLRCAAQTQNWVAQKDIQLKAGNHIVNNAQSVQQAIKQTYRLRAEAIHYQTHQTQAYHSDEKMRLEAGAAMQIHAGEQVTLSVAAHMGVHLDVGRFTLQAGSKSIHINVKQNITLNLAGEGDVQLRCGNSLMRLLPEGKVILQSKTIELAAQQALHIAGTVIWRNHMPAASQASTQPLPLAIKQIDKIIEEGDRLLKLQYTDRSPVCRGPYFLRSENHSKREGLLDESGEAILTDLADEKWVLEGREMIDVTQRYPTQRLPLNKTKHKLDVTCLYPPLILNCHQENKPALTEDQLDYFKRNGNNATIFVHGYNVPVGHYGLYERGGNVLRRTTVYRAPEHIEVPFQANPATATRRHDNGEGAHNWAVHMEHNFNQAAGWRPGQWQDYTRLIHFFWPGDPRNPLDYMAAEEVAEEMAPRLISIINQLHSAGIAVNVVAHSLGCKVALHAMQLSSQQLHHVLLWNAAVPCDAFIQAPDAAQYITVLHSRFDSILGPSNIKEKDTHLTPIIKIMDTVFSLFKFVKIIKRYQSVYQFAHFIGKPISYFVDNPSGRHAFYRTFIKAHPQDWQKHRFANTLNKQTKWFVKHHGLLTLSLASVLYIVCRAKDTDHITEQLAIFEKSPIKYAKSHFNAPYHEIASIILTLLTAENTEPPLPALGYSGYDKTDPRIIKLEKSGKLAAIDQSDLHINHADLKTPSKEMIDNIYNHPTFTTRPFYFGNYRPYV